MQRQFQQIATWANPRIDGQQKTKGIHNWFKYIKWSSSKVYTVNSYHRWAYGKLQRYFQSCSEKSASKDLGKVWIKIYVNVVQHCCSIIKSWQQPFEEIETIVGR